MHCLRLVNISQKVRLRLTPKMLRLSTGSRSLSGNEIQTDGLATAKYWRPKLLRL